MSVFDGGFNRWMQQIDKTVQTVCSVPRGRSVASSGYRSVVKEDFNMDLNQRGHGENEAWRPALTEQKQAG